MGDKEERLLKDAQRMGQPVPKRIADKPLPIKGTDLYYQALWSLTSSRPIFGNGVFGQLPWQVVHNYARSIGLNEEQESDLHYYITELDGIMVSYLNRKR